MPRLVNAEPSSLTDGFTQGDYSLGLFHHDTSESAIELLHHPELQEAVAGSLLNLLDCAAPSGCVHRAELPHKSREAEPAKPVIAQLALRVAEALPDGLNWVARHRVYPRVVAFLRYLEREYTGLHGLFLTHSSLQSGFDSDVLSAGFPDKTVEGPDTNTFMVLEYLALAKLAQGLGKSAEAAELTEKAEALRERMEQLLWFEDDSGGRYTALRWQHGVARLDAERVGTVGPDGKVTPFESWTSLLPLYAGIPSAARAERLVAKLLDPQSYWGPQGVRTAPANDPYFHQARRILHFDFKKGGRGPVSNWSGPVWILSNFYLAKGLYRYGHVEESRKLALKTASLLASGLGRHHMLHECYDDDGIGLWPRQGTFISWNVLALTLLRETT
jgi:putative isomerase